MVKISINEKFQGAKKILSTFDVGIFNAGMWTKKFYKGGSYLKISPKIRITDWNGDGSVLRGAISLIDMCLPAYDGKLDARFKSFVNATVTKLEKNGLVKTTIDAVTDEIKSIPEQLEDLESGKTAQKLFGIFKTGLSNSPTEVSITISNFFGPKQFIIENVQVEFSKEMTEAGPLYVDINMSLSTPMVTVKGQSGLRSVVGKPRFITTD